MIGLVRATVICATLALGLTAAGAADKAFKRDELADSAVKLEAQIKSEAGPVAKSSATLRNDADAAFRRSDFRVGLQILGQIAATTPEDSANWLSILMHSSASVWNAPTSGALLNSAYRIRRRPNRAPRSARGCGPIGPLRVRQRRSVACTPPCSSGSRDPVGREASSSGYRPSLRHRRAITNPYAIISV